MQIRIIEYLIVFASVSLVGTLIAMLQGASFREFPTALVDVILRRPTDVFFYATPLVMSGLAIAIAGQAGLLNIGVEGQLAVGAFVAAIVGHGYAMSANLPLPFYWILLFTLSVGLSGTIAALAGWARAKYEIHEVLTTLFSTFIILAVLNYLVNLRAIRDPLIVPQTRPIMEGLRLQPWMEGCRVHWGFGWALCSVFLCSFMLYRTPIGLRIRGVGENAKVHDQLGYSVTTTYIVTMFMSGAIASLVGIQRVLGEDGRYIEGFSPGYGFIGLGIAFAAQNRPADVLIVSITFALLQTTGASLTYSMSITKEFVDFLQIVLLLLLVLVAKARWAAR